MPVSKEQLCIFCPVGHTGDAVGFDPEQGIAGKVLRDYPLVEAVCVTVHKPEAPLPGKFRDASVTVERKR